MLFVSQGRVRKDGNPIAGTTTLADLAKTSDGLYTFTGGKIMRQVDGNTTLKDIAISFRVVLPSTWRMILPPVKVYSPSEVFARSARVVVPAMGLPSFLTRPWETNSIGLIPVLGW